MAYPLATKLNIGNLRITTPMKGTLKIYIPLIPRVLQKYF